MPAYRQFRAPSEDNGVLIDPGREEHETLVRENLALRECLLAKLEFAGVSGAEVARTARRELVEKAWRHSGFSEPLPELAADTPLILSGHQPELFHSGVWFKNFLLAAIAERSGGVGVHLRIDSDLCREPSVRVLSGAPDSPRLLAVPYDRETDATPYEERRVLDPTLFESFPGRVAEQLGPWGVDPLSSKYWPQAIQSAQKTARLGEALSDLRVAVERTWGLSTVELPLSAVCDTVAFRRFVAELLVRASDLRAAYNGALDAYRQAHRLRTAAQPLPDLGQREGWCETPFWVWSEEEPRRRPLWAKANPHGIELSNGHHWRADLDRHAEVAVEQLGALRATGVKIRGRALATTLYARLVLADLFLHGIGGAKYDQVTDDLCERLFGAAPPAHVTVSASLWLPVPRGEARPPGRGELLHRLRELRFHPERHLDPQRPDAAQWVEQKLRAVRSEKTPQNAAERHRAICQANEAMREKLRPLEAATLKQLAEEESHERLAAVRDSREFSFCLFPEEDLRRRMLALAGLGPSE